MLNFDENSTKMGFLAICFGEYNPTFTIGLNFKPKTVSKIFFLIPLLIFNHTKMSVSEAFGDVASMIAQMNPEKIIKLKASKVMLERVENLVLQKKEGVLSLDESSELERFLALDLFIGLAKARANQLIMNK